MGCDKGMREWAASEGPLADHALQDSSTALTNGTNLGTQGQTQRCGSMAKSNEENSEAAQTASCDNYLYPLAALLPC